MRTTIRRMSPLALRALGGLDDRVDAGALLDAALGLAALPPAALLRGAPLAWCPFDVRFD